MVATQALKQTKPGRWTLTNGPWAVTFEERGARMLVQTSFLNWGGRMQRKPNRWPTREQARQEWRRLVADGYVELK